MDVVTDYFLRDILTYLTAAASTLIARRVLILETVWLVAGIRIPGTDRPTYILGLTVNEGHSRDRVLIIV